MTAEIISRLISKIEEINTKDIIYSTFLVFAVISALSNITLAVANNAVSALEKLAMANVSGFFLVEKKSFLLHPIYLESGRHTKVSIIGGRLTDLDINVYDSDDELIAFDDSCWKDCHINFYAQSDGIYTIKVINHGNSYNEYKLDVKWFYFH